MSHLRLLLLVCMFMIAKNASTQQTFSSSKDSIRYFLDSAFSTIKKNSLYVDRIDWENDIRSFYDSALSKNKFRDIFNLFPLVFDKMRDAHSALWVDSTRYGAKTNFLEKRAPNPVLASAYRGGKAVLMATRMGDYGYIRIPYINMFDQSREAKSKKTQEIQDMVCSIYSPDIKGWIIDLRMDGGGDMYPMIGGIAQLLGEGLIISFKKRNGFAEKITLKNGGIYSDTSLIAQLSKKCLPDMSNAKVAVLVSSYTASSGELTALAFKGRKNTIFIGEKSKGLMTGNSIHQLPFGEGILPMGIILSLSEFYETDRNGKEYTFIYPDIELVGGDDFNDLSKDLKVKKAIEWLSRK